MSDQIFYWFVSYNYTPESKYGATSWGNAVLSTNKKVLNIRETGDCLMKMLDIKGLVIVNYQSITKEEFDENDRSCH